MFKIKGYNHMENSSIDRLVEECQKGNVKAFGELYDIFFPKIHKFVFYKVSKEQVDDIVSTIFLKVWTNIKKYRRTSYPISSWIYRIAQNSIIDHYRTHREFYELEEKIIDDEGNAPQEYTDQKLNSQRVHRALRKLGSPYQDVILLKFMNDLSNEEIARILETNESNVRTLQFRALKKLRHVLEKQEEKSRLFESSPVSRPGILRRIFARFS